MGSADGRKEVISRFKWVRFCQDVWKSDNSETPQGHVLVQQQTCRKLINLLYERSSVFAL